MVLGVEAVAGVVEGVVGVEEGDVDELKER